MSSTASFICRMLHTSQKVLNYNIHRRMKKKDGHLEDLRAKDQPLYQHHHLQRRAYQVHLKKRSRIMQKMEPLTLRLQKSLVLILEISGPVSALDCPFKTRKNPKKFQQPMSLALHNFINANCGSNILQLSKFNQHFADIQ